MVMSPRWGLRTGDGSWADGTDKVCEIICRCDCRASFRFIYGSFISQPQAVKPELIPPQISLSDEDKQVQPLLSTNQAVACMTHIFIEAL